MKISACMIVKNEEKNIVTCIESYKKVVDEVIVVDTGSEDNTVNIAKSLGANVYFYKWNNGFCKAKNFALSKAKGDWIIFLDADEYFYKNKAENLYQILKTIDKNIDGISCNLINIDQDSGSIQDINTTIRIFRNSSMIRFKKDIHEELYKKSGKLNLYFVGEDNLVIYHTGYSTSIIENKILRNIKLIKENMLKNNAESGNYYLCDSYFGIKKYSLAIQYGSKFIDSGCQINGFNSKVYRNIIESMIHLEYNNVEIREMISKAKKVFPKHPMCYYYSAWIDLLENKYTSAYNNLKATVKYQQDYNDVEINSIPSVMYSVFCEMGEICELKNNNIDAIEYYIRSLKENNTYKQAFVKLMNLIKKENCEDIILLLDSIYKKEYEKDLKFLVTELNNLRLGKLLTYYWSKLNKKENKQDLLGVFVLLCNGMYDKAFKIFCEIYTSNWSYWAALNSVTSALLSKNIENINYITNLVKSSFKRIIESFNGNTTLQVI